MCGIVGLFIKKKSLEPRLGELFAGMLQCMGSRGPDSAGFAIYGATVPVGKLKLTLRHANESFSWEELAKHFERKFAAKAPFTVNSTHAIFVLSAGDAAIRRFLREEYPEVRIMSVGRRIEIMKEAGTPASVLNRFKVRQMRGSHAIGHTRMA